MNDINKLKNLLTEFNVEYTVNKHRSHQLASKKETHIECLSNDKNVSGYEYFYTAFAFDENGKFLYMGAWE